MVPLFNISLAALTRHTFQMKKKNTGGIDLRSQMVFFVNMNDNQPHTACITIHYHVFYNYQSIFPVCK